MRTPEESNQKRVKSKAAVPKVFVMVGDACPPQKRGSATDFMNDHREAIPRFVTKLTPTLHAVRCAGAAARVDSPNAGIFAKGDRVSIVKEYLTKGGRGRVQSKVFGTSASFIQDQATAGLSLLKYWRDDAAHGEFRGLSEAQSFTSTLLLLRLAALADDNWDTLTKS